MKALVLFFILIAACSEQNPPDKKKTENLLQPQIDAIDKAKQIEQTMDDRIDHLNQQIER